MKKLLNMFNNLYLSVFSLSTLPPASLFRSFCCVSSRGLLFPSTLWLVLLFFLLLLLLFLHNKKNYPPKLRTLYMTTSEFAIFLLISSISHLFVWLRVYTIFSSSLIRPFLVVIQTAIKWNFIIQNSKADEFRKKYHFLRNVRTTQAIEKSIFLLTNWQHTHTHTW